MKTYNTLAERIADRKQINLDDYRAVQTEESGCKGCAFFKMNVQCSAIPCQKSVARPYAVQYVRKGTK